MTRILLVDGDARHRDATARHLRERGHAVRDFARSDGLPPVEPGTLAILIDDGGRDIQADGDGSADVLGHAIMITDDWSPGAHTDHTRTLLWLRNEAIDVEELSRLVESWADRWSQDTPCGRFAK